LFHGSVTLHISFHDSQAMIASQVSSRACFFDIYREQESTRYENFQSFPFFSLISIILCTYIHKSSISLGYTGEISFGAHRVLCRLSGENIVTMSRRVTKHLSAI